MNNDYCIENDLGRQQEFTEITRLKNLEKLDNKPLNEDQILELNNKFGYFKHGDAQGDVTLAFVRKIEQMHGIG
jgi:hypothetical protein